MEIASEARKTDGCNHSEDGICSYHKEEVEKRGRVEIKIAFLMGVSLIIGSVITAGFIYIRNVKTDLDTSRKEDKTEITSKQFLHEDLYRKKFERMTRDISSLASTTDVLKNTSENTIKAVDRLIASGENTNRAVDRLTGIIEVSLGRGYVPYSKN